MPFDASGLRAYAAELKRAPRKLETQARRVLQASGQRLEGLAKQNAPVDTGNLRSGIHTDNDASGYLQVKVVAPAEYAAYVEYGTSRMAPQPFMGPAVDAIEGPFLDAMEKITEAALE